ncbi:MlrC C-terminal domain-containing protein [Mesorhizobium sp. M1066]|uniref:MlrC C-terminal domain-containing protein n=1 Tax=Mesorhizobium opportunistum TaxID=593909 RepID=A0ABV1YRI9_9HYPH
MKMIWDYRDDLIKMYPALQEQLKDIEQSDRPIIIGDQGDRVAAGGPGGSTYILNLENKINVETYFPIYDPDAVATCDRAGIGGEICLKFGGKYSIASPSVTAKGKVISLGANVPVLYEGPSDCGSGGEHQGTPHKPAVLLYGSRLFQSRGPRS